MQTEGLSATALEKALRRKGAVARGRELKVEKPLQRALCVSDWKDMDMDIDMVNNLGNITFRLLSMLFFLRYMVFGNRVSNFFLSSLFLSLT